VKLRLQREDIILAYLEIFCRYDKSQSSRHFPRAVHLEFLQTLDGERHGGTCLLLSAAVSSLGDWAHVYAHLLILLPSPCTRGEGQGVRGFALCFNWYFDREFNVYPRFRSVNK